MNRKTINFMGIPAATFAFFVLVIFSATSPMIDAHIGDAGNFLYKSYTFVLLWILAHCLYRYRGRHLNKVLFNPATYFLYFLVLQGAITIVSANSSFKIYLFQLFAMLLPSLSILVIASTSFANNPEVTNRLLRFIIVVSVSSLVVDAMGLGEIFMGRYGEIVLERFGFRQLHGFMPWQNTMATLLVISSVLLQINRDKSSASKIGYFATFATLTRGYIISAIVLMIISMKSRLKRLLVMAACFFFIVSWFGMITESTYELADSSSVYRVQHIIGSINVLADYPILGVGLARLSEASAWKLDQFFFQASYGMPITLFATDAAGIIDMGTSDTSVTLLGEIGIFGTILFGFQFYWYVKLAIANNKKYLLVLVPIAITFYSTAGIMFSYGFGVFYWYLFGQLIAMNNENDLVKIKLSNPSPRLVGRRLMIKG